MTKIVCDICGTEIPTIRFFDTDKNQKKFNISSCGRTWDICDECQVDIDNWLTNIRRQREESDETDEKP